MRMQAKPGAKFKERAGWVDKAAVLKMLLSRAASFLRTLENVNWLAAVADRLRQQTSLGARLVPACS